MDAKTYLAILSDYPNLRKNMIGDMSDEEYLKQNPSDTGDTREDELRDRFQYLENVSAFVALEKQYPDFKQIRALGHSLSQSHTPQEALAVAAQIAEAAQQLEASLQQNQEK